MAKDVFISYKSDEEAYAKKIRYVLEANGISCWMAPDSIPLGSNYMKQIPMAIDGCKAMVILISEKSQNSVWVKNEFSQAVSKNKLIIPYVIQNCPLQEEFAFSMSTMQQVYAYRNEQAALEKVVHDIREALGKDSSSNVTINIIPPAKKHNPLLYTLAALGVLLVIAAAFFLLKKPSAPVSSSKEASVYYSEVIPYFLAGSYATPEEAKNDAFEFPKYEKAVSLLSFIRNESNTPLFAEKISCEILDVKEVNVPVLHIDGLFEEDTLSAFVFNSGWGEADPVHAEWSFTREDWVPEFPEFESSLTGEKTLSVSSGSAAELYRTKIDGNALLSWAREHTAEFSGTLYTLTTTVSCKDSEAMLGMYLYYNPETDRLAVTYGGYSDEKPSITLFALLDVENPPKELRFYTGENTPLIEDVYRIETVIIPTRSCNLSLRGKYQLGGKDYATDAYQISVHVPSLEEDSMMVSGPLTRELLRTDMNNPEAVKLVCDKYRYHPESILAAVG